jgi:hypothetical protein
MAMTRFDLLQFEALIFREIGGHFAVRSDHDLVNAASGFFSNFCKLRGCFIDYWRYFGDLFRRQVQLCEKPVQHSDAHQPRMMKFKEKVSRMHCAKECTGHPTRDEHENEAGN